jgi:hypothetical protein
MSLTNKAIDTGVKNRRGNERVVMDVLTTGVNTRGKNCTSILSLMSLTAIFYQFG